MIGGPAERTRSAARHPRVVLEVARELVRNGAVVTPPAVLDLVDPRIVEGFRAQAEGEPTIPPEARERVLVNWLKGYYLQ